MRSSDKTVIEERLMINWLLQELGDNPNLETESGIAQSAAEPQVRQEPGNSGHS